MKTWDGATLICTNKNCKSSDENIKYIKDMDHDSGSCSVYKCTACNESFHIELPD